MWKILIFYENFMDSNTIRNKISLINSELDLLWNQMWIFRLNSVVFQATYKLWSEKIGVSFVNLKKIFFYVFLGYNFDNLVDKFDKIKKTNKKKIILKVSQRKNHDDMWEGYLIKLGIKKESEIIDLNLQKKRIILLFLKIRNHFLILKILKVFIKFYKLTFFEKIFFYLELHYCLKTNFYYSKVINNNNFNELYCVWDNNYPVLAIALWFREQKLDVNSFQFFNFSEDHEFKIHQESTWLNMVANKFYVWWDEYRKFLLNKSLWVDIWIIWNPVYTNYEDIKKIDRNKIILCFNPPEKKQINIDMMNFFNDRKDCDVFYKLHPIDKKGNYPKSLIDNFILLDTYEDCDGVFVVNNSTIYYELIAKWKLVFRYKDEKSFLNNLLEIDDFFSTLKEFDVKLKLVKKDDMKKKQKHIMKQIYDVL